MARVLISGGSGLIGQYLRQVLISKGYEVAWLSRGGTVKKNTPYFVPVFTWNYHLKTIDSEAFHFAENVIHLSGANIGTQRWTRRRRKELWESRVLASRFLVNALKKYRQTSHLISASAIGYYDLKEKNSSPCKEGDPPGFGFLPRMVYQWEREVQMSPFPVCLARFGVVLSKQGSILKRLSQVPILQSLGSGKQILPWIHIDDVCHLLIHLLESKNLTGTFNAVAPEKVSQRDFCRKLALVQNKAYIDWSVPSWVLKLFFGKMAEVLLTGKHICSDKIRDTGFKFKYSELEQALRNV